MSIISPYSSTVNTFLAVTLDVSLHGLYEDTSGYVTVRVWTSTPGNCNLLIYYADDATGLNNIYNSYPVYGNQISTISSLTKKRYVKIALINATTPVVSQTNISIRTKLATRTSNPALNYTTDDITANISIPIGDIKLEQTTDHSGSSIQIYGRTDPVDSTAVADKLAHRPIRTDNCGNITITSIDPSGVAIKPGNQAVFTISGGADGLTVQSLDAAGVAIKPGAGAVFNISTGTTSLSVQSSDTTGVTVKPGVGAVFNISGGAAGLTVKSLDATGVSIKPGTGAVFNISGGATGLAVQSLDATGVSVKPGTGAVFNISGGATGLAVQSLDATGVSVKPGTGAVFNISGGATGLAVQSLDATGISVKPGTGAVFNISGGATGLPVKAFDATGIAIKPANNNVSFNVMSSDPNGIRIRPGTGVSIRSSYLYYMPIIGTYNYIAIGDITPIVVNTIYSLSLSMFNPANPPVRIFVKLFAVSTPLAKPSDITPEMQGITPFQVYELGTGVRDMSFPYGVNVGGKYVYLMVSTVYYPVVGTQNASSDIIAQDNSVFFTITYK